MMELQGKSSRELGLPTILLFQRLMIFSVAGLSKPQNSSASTLSIANYMLFLGGIDECDEFMLSVKMV